MASSTAAWVAKTCSLGEDEQRGIFLQCFWTTVECQLFKVCSLPAAQMQPEIYQRGRRESKYPRTTTKEEPPSATSSSMILGHVNQASMFSSEKKNNTSSQSIVTKTIFKTWLWGLEKKPDFNSNYPCCGGGLMTAYNSDFGGVEISGFCRLLHSSVHIHPYTHKHIIPNK